MGNENFATVLYTVNPYLHQILVNLVTTACRSICCISLWLLPI